MSALELGYQVTAYDPGIKPDSPHYAYPQTSNLLDSADAANMALSGMADSKSSILMGASFVVFSLSIGDIANGKASLPILILTLFSFVATVLGVLTVRPGKLKSFKVTPDNVNLMFFGSFTNISRKEYEDAMIRALSSEEETYRHMARSIYDHGCALKREKYHWLYWSYTSFLFGLIVTFAAVLVQVISR